MDFQVIWHTNKRTDIFNSANTTAWYLTWSSSNSIHSATSHRWKTTKKSQLGSWFWLGFQSVTSLTWIRNVTNWVNLLDATSYYTSVKSPFHHQLLTSYLTSTLHRSFPCNICTYLLCPFYMLSLVHHNFNPWKPKVYYSWPIVWCWEN